MSTTLQETNANESSGYVDSKHFISHKLAKTQSTIKSTEILTSLMGVLTLVVGYLFLFVIADHWLIPRGIGFWPRLLLLVGLISVASAWLATKVVIPYLKKVHLLYAAQVLEKNDPQFRGNLLNLIDLLRSGRAVSPHILSALEKRAAIKLAEVNVDEAVNHRGLLHTSYVLLALVVFSCLYTVFSPKPITPSILAALLPSPERTVATRTEISGIKPGNVTLLARSQLEVTADILGELPDEVTLRYSTADRRHVDEPIRMHPVEEGLRSYRAIITGENGKGILQDFTYSISAGDAVSPEFLVTVKQPPSATVDRVRYNYPRYMAFDAKTQAGGHIDAWEGTTVRVEATANMPVKSASLLFIDEENSTARGEEISMDVENGTRLSLEWPLSIRSDGTSPKFYRIQCLDAEGNTDPAPTVYTLLIRPDLPPEVTLHDPTQDLELPANATVPLAVTAQDPDFMLRYVILRVEKEGEPIWEEPLFEGPPQQQYHGFHDFQLKGLNLQAGEIISYWIEAHDNKEPVANRRSTPRLNIRIQEPVTEEEAQKLLEEQKQEQKEKLEEQLSSDDANDDAEPRDGESQAKDDTESEDSADESGDKGTTSRDGTDPSESSDAESGRDGNDPQPADDKSDTSDDSRNSDDGNKDPSPADPNKNPNDKPGEQQGDKKSPGDKEDETDQNDANKSRDLNSDGSDDDEALRRLLDRQNQEDKKADQDNRQDKSSAKDKKQNDESTGDKSDDKQSQKPNGDDPTNGKNKSDDEGMNDEGTDSSGDEPNSNDPDSNDPNSDKPENGSDENTNSDEPKNKPSDMPGDDEGKNDDKGMNSDSDQDNPGKTDGESKQKGDADSNKNSKANKDQNDDPQEGEGDDGEKIDKPKKKPTRKKEGDVEEGDVSEDEDPDADDQSSDTKKKNTSSQKKNRKPADDDADSDEAGDKTADDAEHGDDADPKSNKTRTKKPNSDKPDSDAEGVEESDDSSDSETSDKNSSDSGEKTDNEKGLTQKGSNSKKNSKSSSDGNKSNNSSDGEGEGEPESSDDTGEGSDNGEKNDSKKMSSDKPGDEEGKASEKKENSDDESSPSDGGKSGSKSDKDSSDGGKGNKPGKEAGSSPSNSNTKGGPGNGNDVSTGGNASDRASSGTGDSATGSGSPNEIEDAEAANLEDKEQAVNLVLKQIEDQLKRGDVDPELLKELGWTEEQMKKFVERMQQQLKQLDEQPQSPQDQARRIQFEEMLKSLDSTGQPEKRTGQNVKKTAENEFGPRRLDVPSEYREATEAFTKSLSKIKNQPKK